MEGGERKAEVKRCESRSLRGHGSEDRNKHEPLSLNIIGNTFKKNARGSAY